MTSALRWMTPGRLTIWRSLAASLLLALTVFVFSALAHAQSVAPMQSGGGWGALPLVFGQALAVIIYARAVEWIWWLVVATVLAWCFHLFIKHQAGLTHSNPVGTRRNPYRRERDSSRLRWLLPFIHIPLTFVTVLALIVIWSGNRAGLEFRSKAERSVLEPRIAPIYGPLNNPWTGMSPERGPGPNFERKPWPERSGYIPGMVLSANKGLGTVVLDNTQGSDSVAAKLCLRDTGPATKKTRPGCMHQRYFYVRKGEVFELESVSLGGYEIQFIEIQSGKAKASAYFRVPHDQPIVHEIKLFAAPGQAPHRDIPSTDF